MRPWRFNWLSKQLRNFDEVTMSFTNMISRIVNKPKEVLYTQPGELIKFQRLLQYISWILGIALVIWAVLDPRFRNPDLTLKGSICLPISSGLALMLVGWGITRNIRVFTFWIALGLVGQAASLQLIDAGTAIHWQHFKTFSQMVAPDDLPALLIILGQTFIVLLGMRRRIGKLFFWLREHFKLWQLIAIALVFLLPSAAAERDIPAYISSLVFAMFVEIVNLGNIILIAWSIPQETLTSLHQKLENVFRWFTSDIKIVRIDRFALLGALWVTLFSAILGYFSYQWHPHITDEVEYVLQARFLADGAITLPAPPVPDGFEIYLMEVKGNQWWPSTPPGWPAVLAIGYLLGVPGLVNPALAGINILLIYLLLQELYDRRSARMAVFLLCVSPWYVFMGMNFMTHMVTLTLILIAALAVIQARKNGKAWWGLIAGAAVGAGTLVRPLDGLIVAICIGLWVIGIGGKRLNFASIATFALGAIIIGGLNLPYNKLLTGSLFTFPVNSYLDGHFGPGRNALGFGPNRGYGWPIQPFQGHSPLGAMINSNLNTFSIDIELFGWGLGSLLLAAVIIFSGSLILSDYLMLFLIFANYTPYFFYYFSGGPDFGARYWFIMLLPLVALSVRGIQYLQRKLEEGAVKIPFIGDRLLAAVVILSALTLVNYFPWRAIDKYFRYWGMRPDVVNLANEYHFGKSLVLIRGNVSHPDYASAAIYNPLKWNADAPIYAWDRNQQVETQLLNAFPNRPIWIVDAPALTQNGYQVVAGPLSADRVKFVEQSLPPVNN
jgi:hypothetical protein